jgi:hypothetical protein
MTSVRTNENRPANRVSLKPPTIGGPRVRNQSDRMQNLLHGKQNLWRRFVTNIPANGRFRGPGAQEAFPVFTGRSRGFG